MYYGQWSQRTVHSRTAHWDRLSKVLEVVNEVRQLSALVHFFAGRHHALRQWPWPATEHPNFAHLKSDKKKFDFIRPRRRPNGDKTRRFQPKSPKCHIFWNFRQWRITLIIFVLPTYFTIRYEYRYFFWKTRVEVNAFEKFLRKN